jgi:hypothetical protein
MTALLSGGKFADFNALDAQLRADINVNARAELWNVAQQKVDLPSVSALLVEGANGLVSLKGSIRCANSIDAQKVAGDLRTYLLNTTPFRGTTKALATAVKADPLLLLFAPKDSTVNGQPVQHPIATPAPQPAAAPAPQRNEIVHSQASYEQRRQDLVVPSRRAFEGMRPANYEPPYIPHNATIDDLIIGKMPPTSRYSVPLDQHESELQRQYPLYHNHRGYVQSTGGPYSAEHHYQHPQLPPPPTTHASSLGRASPYRDSPSRRPAVTEYYRDEPRLARSSQYEYAAPHSDRVYYRPEDLAATSTSQPPINRSPTREVYESRNRAALASAQRSTSQRAVMRSPHRTTDTTTYRTQEYRTEPIDRSTRASPARTTSRVQRW